jgi:crotonobetainyl-CoA:carnitine CoA-transferase CaiB-like acyl-CoA transferase
VKNIAEVVNDPHLKVREYFVEVEHPATGTLKYPGAPYKISETPWKIDKAAPQLGEHNEEIFCQRLGYSKKELSQLHRRGII